MLLASLLQAFARARCMHSRSGSAITSDSLRWAVALVYLFGDYATRSLAAPWLSNGDLGVSHIAIPLQLSNHTCHTDGVFHVFVKANAAQGNITLHAIAFFDETTSEPQYVTERFGRMRAGPWGEGDWNVPQLHLAHNSIADLPTAVMHSDLTWDVPDITTRRFPLAINSTWTSTSLTASSYILELRGNGQSSIAVVEPDTLREPAGTAGFVVLLGQYFTPAHMGVPLLQVHTAWHKLVGFQGTLLYAHTAFLVELFKQDSVAQLASKGDLVAYAFDSLPLLRHYTGNDQHVLENYALLTLKGHNLWVLSIDIDEFLVFHMPGPIQLQMQGCMAAELPNVFHHVQRQNLLISKYVAENQGGDWPIWQQALQDLSEHGAQNDSNVLQTLTMYDSHMLNGNRPKILFHSDITYVLATHHCMAPNGNVSVNKQECAYLGHLRNLYRTRTDMPATQPTGPWWALAAPFLGTSHYFPGHSSRTG